MGSAIGGGSGEADDDGGGGFGEFRYIATMCPKASTFADFWQMVWHARARVVVNSF